MSSFESLGSEQLKWLFHVTSKSSFSPSATRWHGANNVRNIAQGSYCLANYIKRIDLVGNLVVS